SSSLEVDAKHIINAEGLFVCPGFIDAHAHSDFTLIADGRAEAKVCQGVTTEINGNCGFSGAPLFGESKKKREGIQKGYNIAERWSTFEEFFSILKKRGISINYVALVGHGNIRGSILGYHNRRPEHGELKDMRALLRDALNAGVFGMSTALVYPPGSYAHRDEIATLLKDVSLYKGIYTTHMRSEGDRLLESIEESMWIAKEAGIHLHISHLKTSGKRNWWKLRPAISMIEKARREGLSLSCDRYPYTASCTDLDILLPTNIFDGGDEAALDRLIKQRALIEKELSIRSDEDGYWKGVVISSLFLDRNKWMEGLSIDEIAQKLGKDPVDVVIDILIEEHFKVGAIFFGMSEENLKVILKQPYTVIGSDSSARSFSGITASGRPHPRGFGTFPKVIGKYAREEGVLSLQEAVYKMTGLTAELFGIKHRGVIKKGNYADIVIFDADKIIDRAEYKAPFKRPEGIYFVFVNGSPTLYEGELTGLKPGRIIKRGAA
ncbi:MAG: D-aminoacylase, partial [Nitrospirae bacterium]